VHSLSVQDSAAVGSSESSSSALSSISGSSNSSGSLGSHSAEDSQFVGSDHSGTSDGSASSVKVETSTVSG
jgi:hypothetical protein